MHDLNTINRLNREATDSFLHTTRSKGKWIAAFYTGLHIVAWSSFDTEREARDHVADQNTKPKSPDSYWRVLAPIGALHGLKRDQSEDRKTTTIVVFTGDGQRHEASAADLAPTTTTTTTAAPTDGWIEWSGGPCPVPGRTTVKVKFRGLGGGDGYAGALDWTNTDTSSDIVAYRVVEAIKPELKPAKTQELTLGDVIAKLEALERAFREEFAKRPTTDTRLAPPSFASDPWPTIPAHGAK